MNTWCFLLCQKVKTEEEMFNKSDRAGDSHPATGNTCNSGSVNLSLQPYQKSRALYEYELLCCFPCLEMLPASSTLRNSPPQQRRTLQHHRDKTSRPAAKQKPEAIELVALCERAHGGATIYDSCLTRSSRARTST